MLKFVYDFTIIVITHLCFEDTTLFIQYNFVQVMKTQEGYHILLCIWSWEVGKTSVLTWIKFLIAQVSVLAKFTMLMNAANSYTTWPKVTILLFPRKIRITHLYMPLMIRGSFCLNHAACWELTPKTLALTAHNWQKWKRVFLTCPWHKNL